MCPQPASLTVSKTNDDEIWVWGKDREYEGGGGLTEKEKKEKERDAEDITDNDKVKRENTRDDGWFKKKLYIWYLTTTNEKDWLNSTFNSTRPKTRLWGTEVAYSPFNTSKLRKHSFYEFTVNKKCLWELDVHLKQQLFNSKVSPTVQKNNKIKYFFKHFCWQSCLFSNTSINTKWDILN